MERKDRGGTGVNEDNQETAKQDLNLLQALNKAMISCIVIQLIKGNRHFLLYDAQDMCKRVS